MTLAASEFNTQSPTAPALRLADGEGDDGPVWVEMLRTGVNRSRFVGGTSASGHDSATFTRDDLESAARGFAIARAEGYLVGDGAPVGYDHSEFAHALRLVTGEEPDPGELAAAAAWYSDVKVEPNADGGHSLLGLHSFVAAGRDRVRSKALQGYSIDIAPAGSMQRKDGTPINEWVPFGGTLTNSPFIRSMAPLAATEQPPQHREIDPMIKILRETLALQDDATEAQALSALHTLQEQAAKAEVLASELHAMTEARDAAGEQVKALSERNDEVTVIQAVHDGRIGKADGPRYLKVLKALGEEEAHAIFKAGAIQTAPAVVVGQPKGEEPAQSADELFDAIFAKALSEGKDDRAAYRLADDATREQRNAAYTTTTTAAEA